MFKILEIMGNNSKNIYKKYSLKVMKKEFAFIKWYPHAITEVHGHNGKDCTFVLLNGTLLETIYDTSHNYEKPTKLNRRDRFDIGYINDEIGLHSVQNPSNKNKYSLHYYR